MFYWALNRERGRGLVLYGLGEAFVTASSEDGNGRSRPINSGTFSTLRETVGFPRLIILHFFFIYAFFSAYCCTLSLLQKVSTVSVSKLLFTNRSILCRSPWRSFSIEAPPYGLIGKNSSSIQSPNQLRVLHEKSDVSDLTLYKFLYL